MIRLAQEKELDLILDIYESAKKYMRKTGNMHQWSNNYPNYDLLKEDIQNKRLFICYDDVIYGAFVFFCGIDKTYNYIEGCWLNDELYGVIHKVASNGLKRGVFNEILSFCSERCKNIRIDTHHDNIVMQRKLDSLNFKKCGIIYLENKEPRIAYHYIKKEE